MHTLCGHVFAKNEIIKCEMKRYGKYKQKCVNNMSREGNGGANWPDGQLDATLCRAEHLKQFPINDNNVSFRHRCVLCPFSRCLFIILARRQVPGKQAKWQVEHGGRGAGGEGSPGMQASFYDDVTNGALSPD